MRQIPNFRIYALGRPQMGQRLYPLTLNLGSRFAFILSAFFAKSASYHAARNGNFLAFCACLIVFNHFGLIRFSGSASKWHAQ
jgi:hypothetical protein